MAKSQVLFLFFCCIAIFTGFFLLNPSKTFARDCDGSSGWAPYEWCGSSWLDPDYCCAPNEQKGNNVCNDRKQCLSDANGDCVSGPYTINDRTEHSCTRLSYCGICYAGATNTETRYIESCTNTACGGNYCSVDVVVEERTSTCNSDCGGWSVTQDWHQVDAYPQCPYDYSVCGSCAAEPTPTPGGPTLTPTPTPTTGPTPTSPPPTTPTPTQPPPSCKDNYECYQWCQYEAGRSTACAVNPSTGYSACINYPVRPSACNNGLWREIYQKENQGRNFAELRVQGLDDRVDDQWCGNQNPIPIVGGGCGLNPFDVRWSGYVKVPLGDRSWTFGVYHSRGVALYINGNRIIYDGWGNDECNSITGCGIHYGSAYFNYPGWYPIQLDLEANPGEKGEAKLGYADPLSGQTINLIGIGGDTECGAEHGGYDEIHPNSIIPTSNLATDKNACQFPGAAVYGTTSTSVGQSPTWNGSFSGNARSSQVFIALEGAASSMPGCPAGRVAGNWCNITPTSDYLVTDTEETDKAFTTSPFTFTQTGTYWVQINGMTNSTGWDGSDGTKNCTGNPSFKFNNSSGTVDRYWGAVDCGPSDWLTVTVNVITSKTWTINSEPICSNGNPVSERTRAWNFIWPPNPGVETTDSLNAGLHNQTITSTATENNVYVGMQTEDGAFLNTYGSPPHSSITYSNYFGITNLASWQRNNLPEGTYRIQFEALDSWCNVVTPTPTPTPVVTYNVSGNIFIDSNKNGVKDGGESNYTVGTSTIQIDKCDNPGCSSTTQIASTTTNNGVYTTSIPAGTYMFSYTSRPLGYVMTYPTGTPPSFIVTVGPGCSVAGTNATCDASGNIQNLNFGINLPPWFQGDSDMRIDSGFNDPIPQTLVNTYASPNNASGYPGIIFYGSGFYSFCSGGTCPEIASSKGWLVAGNFTPVNPGVIRTSNDYMKTTAKQSGITTSALTSACAGGTLTPCTLQAGLASGIYQGTGPMTLNSYTFSTGRDYVFIIDGDLTINGNILVPNGSTATFTVSGNITVDKSVGAASTSTACVPSTVLNGTSTGCQIEGFYSADGDFVLNGNNDNCTTADKRLNIAGSIAVNAKLQGKAFKNNRDLCGSNANYPSFYIVGRPDLILNAPDFIKHPNSVWQEVAP